MDVRKIHKKLAPAPPEGRRRNPRAQSEEAMSPQPILIQVNVQP